MNHDCTYEFLGLDGEGIRLAPCPACGDVPDVSSLNEKLFEDEGEPFAQEEYDRDQEEDALIW